jgi:peptidoglycan/xylan/chitin deacetylase (PgdA/CDA1 family)
MPISISRRGLLAQALIAAPAGRPLGTVLTPPVITHLPTAKKLVALTFDACETITPAFLDQGIRDLLVARRIPFTIFACGRFARHNVDALAELARLDFVEIENHSMNHDNHMERLDDAHVRSEVTEAETLLRQITGRQPKYFRFPAGNYDARSLASVESLGYKVVHWSFASGDPDKHIDPAKLTEWVLYKTRPGGILIFHINGRGWSTAKALPAILSGLAARGYDFVRLDSLVG